MMKIGYFGTITLTVLLVACGGNEEAETTPTDSTNVVTVDTDNFLAELADLEERLENSNGLPKEKDMEDAITRFQDFAALFPEDPKAPDYLLRASDLALISDQPQKSVKLLNRIINDYPDYPKMEDVKYNRASHLDFELRDTTKAKEAYQEFIDAYPNSPLINDCKSRIENIQYSLEELTEKFMNELEENGAENELP